MMEFAEIMSLAGDSIVVAILAYLLFDERKARREAEESSRRFQFRMIEYFLQTFNTQLNREREDDDSDRPRTKVLVRPELDAEEADRYFRERE
jgi:hypothetical protein